MLTYAYNYAQIDASTNMCIGVHTSTTQQEDPYWVEIPAYDDVFVFKYYNFDDQKWYNDSAMTDEFVYEG